MVHSHVPRENCCEGVEHMQAGIYIELNIISCFFCILLYFQQRKHKVFDFLGTTEFNSLLWAVVYITLVDMVFWLMNAGIIPRSTAGIMFVQSLYYIIQALLPLFFFTYCINITGRIITPFWQVLMYVPAVFTAVLVVINYQSGIALYVANGEVERGELYLLLIAAPLIYIFNSLLLCIVFYCKNFNSSLGKRKISFHMLICVVFCFLGAAACAVVSYISPWIVFVTALIYLYLNLHSYRENQLYVTAHTDSLTGLKNYAAFSRIRSQKNSDIAENRNTKFAVALMDINDLKKVNDAYGHEAGDALIVRTGELMAKVFCNSTVCRIGGDEFVAVLEGKDYINRDGLQQLFSHEMKTTTFVSGDKELPVSASIGIVSYAPDFHKGFDDVIDAADEVMYKNKLSYRAAKKAIKK